jgi:hypothetical protein
MPREFIVTAPKTIQFREYTEPALMPDDFQPGFIFKAGEVPVGHPTRANKCYFHTPLLQKIIVDYG